MSMHGPVRMLRSDEGTNFIGAKKNELEDSIALVKSDTVKEFILKHNCGIHFVFNPLNSSHFCGVF